MASVMWNNPSEKLDQEFASMLADDSRWKMPNHKIRRRLSMIAGSILGSIVGFMLTIIVMKIIGLI